jgi:hypothetical protein
VVIARSSLGGTRDKREPWEPKGNNKREPIKLGRQKRRSGTAWRNCHPEILLRACMTSMPAVDEIAIVTQGRGLPTGQNNHPGERSQMRLGAILVVCAVPCCIRRLAVSSSVLAPFSFSFSFASCICIDDTRDSAGAHLGLLRLQ